MRRRRAGTLAGGASGWPWRETAAKSFLSRPTPYSCIPSPQVVTYCPPCAVAGAQPLACAACEAAPVAAGGHAAHAPLRVRRASYAAAVALADVGPGAGRGVQSYKVNGARVVMLRPRRPPTAPPPSGNRCRACESGAADGFAFCSLACSMGEEDGEGGAGGAGALSWPRPPPCPRVASAGGSAAGSLAVPRTPSARGSRSPGGCGCPASGGVITPPSAESGCASAGAARCGAYRPPTAAAVAAALFARMPPGALRARLVESRVQRALPASCATAARSAWRKRGSGRRAPLE
jgi:hypothetical protein